jgi:hypothetical protein
MNRRNTRHLHFKKKSLNLPPNWMHWAMEKIMKVLLWMRTKVLQNGKSSVVWSRVQRPLDLGV